MEEENKLKSKYKKGEIQKIIKKYLTPTKKEDKNNTQVLTDNTDKDIEINEKEEKKENDTVEKSPNIDVKLKLEWVRKDLSKEMEQAENYFKEFKKKVEENTKKMILYAY